MKNIIATVLLTLPVVAARLLNDARKRDVVFLRFAARLCLALVLFTTGIAHFTQTEGMMMLLPSWVPMASDLIVASGVFEIIAGFALLLIKTALS